jgi:folate-binding protein YgfZ
MSATSKRITTLALAAFLLIPSQIASFSLRPTTTTPLPQRTVCFSTFDYEYLPPNPNANPEETPSQLSSSYPDGTPAGLRGEAVRSALLSGRCIGWDVLSENGGILQIKGKGMQDFLNSKLTQSFSSGMNNNSFQEACLLDAKGRVVDRLLVSIVDSETALVLTSPGHSSQELLKRFDPFIFPLDQIELTNFDQSFTFTLASTQWKDVQKVLLEQALPNNKGQSFSFPSRSNQCVEWQWDDETKVLVMPSTGLVSQVCAGYTLVFYGSKEAHAIGQQMWQYLIGDGNPSGPIEVGALEYETLRIEAGQPAYGQEIGKLHKTSPLELHWQDTINMEKGCYLGQEGIASIVKNPRGPPRTLYAVVFENESNVYETQSRGDKSDYENLTTPPKPGQSLYALGSNEQLSVGTLTSVAEADGTGEPCTVALAVVRRADSIMRQMKNLDLQIPRDTQDFVDIDEASGMIEPPPLDPLDGLEVIVGGTFTVGKLRMIPSRRFRKGRNMFDDKVVVEELEGSEELIVVKPTKESSDEADLEEIQAEKAKAEAEEALAKANRKVEKMEMLKKRAEEAMARRKNKKQ